MHADDKLFATVGLGVLVVVVAVALVASGGLSWHSAGGDQTGWTVSTSVPQAVPEPAAVDTGRSMPAADTVAAVDEAPVDTAPAAAPAATACGVDATVAAVDTIAAGEIPAAWLEAVNGRSEVLVRRTADDRLVLADGTFRRYRGLVEGLAGFEPAAIAAACGSADGSTRNGVRRASLGPSTTARLVAAIDQLLAAPVLAEPAEMESRGGRWRFADETLNALTPAQQQLILMGPDNAAAVRGFLASLRRELRCAEPASPEAVSGSASSVVGAAPSMPATIATGEDEVATTSP